MKHAILNRDLGEVRTVIVLGVGRGGTSLIAGCLRALGICMGSSPHPLKHEWSPMIYGPDGKIDLPSTHRVVQEMDAVQEKWGWKSPRDVFQLEQLLPLLRDPGFVFVTRDLLEASLSGMEYQDVPLPISLDETALVYRAITTRLRYWPWPALTVAFAEALRHPRELMDLLCSFMSIDPTPAAREQAVSFVQPGTNAYRLFDAKPGDPPLLTSAEDLRADSEGLAADFSRRYGQEYWRQFENVLKETRTVVGQLSSAAKKTVATKIMPMVDSFISAPHQKGTFFSLIKRAIEPGESGAGVESILDRLTTAAAEAKRRLETRAPDSGYDDLSRLYRVIQVTIRVRHAVQRALLAAQLGNGRE